MNEMAGFIDCPKCGRRSYNPNDIAHRYCGACHEYHDQMRLPLDHPDAPKFWLNESSGVLAPIVVKYVNGEALDSAEVKHFKAYLWQWISSPVWAPSGILEATRLRVAAIETGADITGALDAMEELGMDPL